MLAGGSALASGPNPGSWSFAPAPGTTIAREPVAAGTDQQTGVAMVDTTLGYQGVQAAGTGLVLTADGVVLTNTHVIAGATEVRVTVGRPGVTYTATVVGSDAHRDVAVLQIDDPDGLVPVRVDQDENLAPGDSVTVVGNARGADSLVAAAGMVTALDRTITTRAQGSAVGRELEGLIEVDAEVVAGDSGGAVLDADGELVGMTTAASVGDEDLRGYAIPVGDVLDIAAQVLSGDESGTVTIGYPAFLGVQLVLGATEGPTGALAGGTQVGAPWATTFGSVRGAPVAGVLPGTPAARAGLVTGDVVTTFDGHDVRSADELSARIDEHEPGDRVRVGWVSKATGTARTATVTLVEGPAG
ncbi:S1C family serine protease [Cellulomonas sp. P22]|uniref:S1C family serine protease n=1 Tax=Cellulomonas sp. P22 TaxID=3373189 RepID=UPI00379A4C70